jgi:NTE family protein
VLGKVLNAFLLDHIQSDFEVLRRVNHMIDDGERAFGPGFVSKINEAAAARGALPYRRVKTLVVRPSMDIGRLAAAHVKAGKLRKGPIVARRFLSLVDVGEETEADLASYLLFDGSFTRKLIALGRADAEARRNELLEFFGSARDDVEPRSSESGEWSIPPPVGPGSMT